MAASDNAAATVTTPTDREIVTFENLGRGRTRVVSRALFHTPGERDGMLEAGMGDGMNESYAALDKLLADRA